MMVDSSRQAWVDAVAAGETTDSFLDWWAARERKALAEDEDGPETIEFSLRIGVTTRAFYEIEFEAESLENAREHAAMIDPAEYLAHFPEGIEGDQIGYLRQSDDFTRDDIEIDLRDEGEPFSWEACEIVKKLAALSGQDPTGDGVCAIVRQLIARAHRSCV
ncbi:MAG: hypothetical protein EOS63_01510 [Mesorhizobium sp.]|uniref:hypothetical protein n=1 Tax=Mesorhizobium sp. TaxID=1871066 RepID=UPI000FEA8E03|nr:hypothetical protein [Mesorhizobium sp.]RWE85340.1 MAG: hypothetical protein EOS63_01510 [Mesorhizobium sp.]TJW64666.1 MAG: hypothetical protein E5V97_05720 [Mesorhizobium sp.]